MISKVVDALQDPRNGWIGRGTCALDMAHVLDCGTHLHLWNVVAFLCMWKDWSVT